MKPSSSTPHQACSHVWKDRRFIHQFVYNWPVAPHIDPSTPLDGEPRRHMQYGQEYECQNCHQMLFSLRLQ
jgi:hypothetical protein